MTMRPLMEAFLVLAGDWAHILYIQYKGVDVSLGSQPATHCARLLVISSVGSLFSRRAGTATSRFILFVYS